MKIENWKLKILNVVIPTFRLDISIPEDLIEEIGRIYGYQKIKAAFPTATLIPPKRNTDRFWEEMTKNILKEAGFSEVYNYSFISENDAKVFGWHPQAIIELENPLSKEQKYLRPSLVPNLLKNVQKNQNYYNEIKIFELGKIFEKPKKEKRILAGILTGDMFYQTKGVVDLLLNKLGISDIYYKEFKLTNEEIKKNWWYPKKSADIIINGERIGFLGEVTSKILAEFKINLKVVYFAVRFDELSKFASEETIYQPISRFPAA
ncbi:unnamed protein product, partial [marine sediment metagenome]